jgi:predicted kinase
MVRAKIALLTRGNPGLSEDEKVALLDQYRSYATLADSYSAIPNCYLLVTTGLSGSGKTFISGTLASRLCLIRLRSDVERKRLYGLAPLASSHDGQHPDIYTEQANQKTYEHLANLSRSLLDAGIPVIVDAACLKQVERELLETAAMGAGAPFALLNCQAPEEQRREWLRRRVNDASEATETLMAEQEKWVEPLSDRERMHTVHVRTDAEAVPDLLVAQILKHFGGGC